MIRCMERPKCGTVYRPLSFMNNRIFLLVRKRVQHARQIFMSLRHILWRRNVYSKFGLKCVITSGSFIRIARTTTIWENLFWRPAISRKEIHKLTFDINSCSWKGFYLKMPFLRVLTNLGRNQLPNGFMPKFSSRVAEILEKDPKAMKWILETDKQMAMVTRNF